MKRNPFSLLLLTGLSIFTTITYAQENNYLVSKYDFIPGEKVIFFDDFTSESVGDFPAQWLTNGSGEIVTSEKFPGRWFNMTKMGYYIPEAIEDFTDNFTIEFDFVPMNTANSETMFGLSFYLLTGSLSEPGGGGEPADAGLQIFLDYDNLGWKNWSLDTEQRFNGTVTYPFKSNEKYHIAIWVQKQRVRFYANENKVLDVPRAIQAGKKPNIFRFDSREEAIPIISNFRIAAGLPDMRNRLLKDGKIISYGIQFDVNSDKLKPESYSTLKEIADILKENPTIRIQVVGHTDSDGDGASNLDLSKRRGASVKNELVNKFGVDPGRLETDGKGESEPIAGNDSAVNKAKNRRVEFINIMGETKPEPTAKIPVNQKPGSLTDPDGYSYKIVTIGTQTWMAENLRTTKYRNGELIGSTPSPTTNIRDKAASSKYQWAYGGDESNVAVYGRLYTWSVVTDSRNICPAGWHLPAKEEWLVIVKSLGSSDDTGNKLKEAGTKHWISPNDGVTNGTGFTAVPGGFRSYDGPFVTIGYTGIYWSSTGTSTFDANKIYFYNDNSGLVTGYGGDESGVSVRCVKD
jgi:uncharacterized protein (TIGR02145 family)